MKIWYSRNWLLVEFSILYRPLKAGISQMIQWHWWSPLDMLWPALSPSLHLAKHYSLLTCMLSQQWLPLLEKWLLPHENEGLAIGRDVSNTVWGGVYNLWTYPFGKQKEPKDQADKIIPRYPRGIGYRILMETQTHWCSNSLYKGIVFALIPMHCPGYFKPSLDYL
jgi:hypothetical protein